MDYRLVDKRECMYCGGSTRCYTCGGIGGAGYEENIPCEDCNATGTCMECVDGREMWLLFDVAGGTRGSMLRHVEAVRYQDSGELPDWFEKYHGIK